MHSLNHNGKALLGRESKKAVHFVADFFNITQVMVMVMMMMMMQNDIADYDKNVALALQ